MPGHLGPRRPDDGELASFTAVRSFAGYWNDEGPPTAEVLERDGWFPQPVTLARIGRTRAFRADHRSARRRSW